jgi:hypothetical protein
MDCKVTVWIDPFPSPSDSPISISCPVGYRVAVGAEYAFVNPGLQAIARQIVDGLLDGQAEVDYSEIMGTLLPTWLAQPTDTASPQTLGQVTHLVLPLVGWWVYVDASLSGNP